MRISHAKSLKEMIKVIHSIDLIKVLGKFKETDVKGRYLHWNDFKYKKNDEDIDIDLAWAATKISRLQSSKKINIGEYQFSFCVPDSLQRDLHTIDKKSSGYIGTNNPESMDGVNNKYLVHSLIMEEAISSAQLEGASTTRRIAKKMLELDRKPKNKSEIMILNNYLLMKKALEMKNESLSIELILSFHEIATTGAIENNAVCGEFRQTDDIYVRNHLQEVIYTPPKADKLYDLMSDLCNFVNTRHDCEEGEFFIHPVIKAILLHFFIGFIHPFGDGNGRTARALFYWFMMKSGYWLFEYTSISKLIKNAPIQYAKAYLYVEDDELDTTYFLYHQIDIIMRSIDELNNYLHRKQRELAYFLTRIKNSKIASKLNFRQIDILKKAAKEPGRQFIAKSISIEYSVSENTARSDLKGLEDNGLLLLIGNSKVRTYISPSDLLDNLLDN
ncbi:Fic family protein [Frischella sp. Ac48]|uniref:Fic family protein n=1 Tax=Frischella japonica TaxID=2741544 RepID=A0ABR7QZ04_9GAMM|nr:MULTISPECIES: Fic family protein [Frischella]MBC9131442.1 Fic family protein [Frischella japonica]MBX4133896.1 Fic family protein [Frischella sp. Ac48]